MNDAQFIPAAGWYFTHPNVTPNEPRIFYRVAMWRVESDGAIVGMVSINYPESPAAPPANRLVAPPPVRGIYVHIDDLTHEDQARITEMRFS